MGPGVSLPIGELRLGAAPPLWMLINRFQVFGARNPWGLLSRAILTTFN